MKLLSKIFSHKVFRSVKYKIFIALSAYIAVVTVLFILFFPIRSEKEVIQSNLEKADLITKTVSSIFSQNIYIQNMSAIKGELTELWNDYELLYLTVLDDSGKIVVDFTTNENKKDLYKTLTSEDQFWFDGQAINKTANIIYNKKSIGVLSFGLPTIFSSTIEKTIQINK